MTPKGFFYEEKKNTKNVSNQIFKHNREAIGHRRRSFDIKNKVARRAKREDGYFTPYTGASPVANTLDKRRFLPFGPEVQRVQTTRSDGYLTSGTFLDKIRFNNPLNELPCIRRRARRRVIFAFNLSKKGSGAKKHRFTLESSISCKG